MFRRAGLPLSCGSQLPPQPGQHVQIPATRMFLKRVVISNLRSIADLELDFTADDGLRRRTVLLGENGCGKSTALRAIALALAGSDALAELLKEPARWVRMKKAEARIELTLSTKNDGDRAVVLVLRPEWRLRDALKHNEQGLALLDAALEHTSRNWFVIGYGVTRRPTTSKFSSPGHTEGALVHPRARGLATMFDPDATLVSFEQWAMDLDYRGGKAAMAILRRAMKTLLPGMTFDRIDRKRREVLFKTVDGLVPFQQLSDGYQNVANWCGDVLYRITTTFEDYKDPLRTRGLLLIDEIDVHLHPVWQRRLMEFLGKALPNMQIVATSHSPLIAQQLREGDLYVVERRSPRSGASIRAVAGDPSRLSLPQLLPPVFGIESADSVRVESLRQKAREQPLTAAERRELAEMPVIEQLPPSVRAQIRATEEMTVALAKLSGVEAPKLDPEQLRRRLTKKITLAD